MALCFTHATAGYLAYEALRPAGAHRPGMLAAAVVASNAPDLDFLPGLVVGTPAVFHRGITHTVVAAMMVAAIGWLVGRWRQPGGLSGSFCAALVGGAYALHLLVDWVTVDAVPPAGAQFLWPFSSHYQHAPVAAFREIVIDPSGRAAFVASLLGPSARGVWLAEVGQALAVVGLLALVRALGRARVARLAG